MSRLFYTVSGFIHGVNKRLITGNRHEVVLYVNLSYHRLLRFFAARLTVAHPAKATNELQRTGKTIRVKYMKAMYHMPDPQSLYF